MSDPTESGQHAERRPLEAFLDYDPVVFEPETTGSPGGEGGEGSVGDPDETEEERDAVSAGRIGVVVVGRSAWPHRVALDAPGGWHNNRALR